VYSQTLPTLYLYTYFSFCENMEGMLLSLLPLHMYYLLPVYVCVVLFFC
jgi:hypothetical protein